MSSNAKSIALFFVTFVLVTVIFICAAFPATLPGDATGDFAVNAADYASFRKAGTSTATWRQNFGISAATNGVTIAAGSDIQAAINANPANTIFYLPAGVTRITSPITPKSGDAFVGAPGAIINGSRLLTSFTSSSGKWYASGQTQQGITAGNCLSAFSRCGHPEDVYLDDAPLLHVGSLAAVGPGKWYFDYAADRIYLGDNPSGHKVETSIASAAIKGNITTPNVTLYGLTIEKFATQSQKAAVDNNGGASWIVDNCTVTLNHAGGVNVHGGIVRNSKLNKNGQWGLGDAALTEYSELAYNNYAGYDYAWSAGGAKFAFSNGITIRNNYVHDNFGVGLWDDLDSHNVLYENNVITNNYLSGIEHEIGQDAVIRNNIFYGNAAHATGLESQIMVYSSSNTEIYGNRVTSNAPASHGILVIQDNRGGHYSHDVYVHDNVITVLAGGAGDGNAKTGIVEYNGYWPSGVNIMFDYNTYYAADASAKHWEWKDAVTWSVFRTAGQEPHGQVSAVVSPLPGDYNRNGVVDAADYTVWCKNVKTGNVLANDPIGGRIGQAQYDLWRAHFGQTGGSGVGTSANAAVPEPTTLVLVFLGALALLSRRRSAVSLTHE